MNQWEDRKKSLEQKLKSREDKKGLLLVELAEIQEEIVKIKYEITEAEGTRSIRQLMDEYDEVPNYFHLIEKTN